MNTITTTTIRKDLPGWLVVMLLLIGTAFYPPFESNQSNRPAVQHEAVCYGRCCKGKTIGYLRALLAGSPRVAYSLPVAHLLAYTEQQTSIQLRHAKETRWRFETALHLPILKTALDPSPTDPHVMI